MEIGSPGYQQGDGTYRARDERVDCVFLWLVQGKAWHKHSGISGVQSQAGSRMFHAQGCQRAEGPEGSLSAEDVLCTCSPKSLTLCYLLVRRINTSDDECNNEDLNWGELDPVRVTSSAGEIQNAFSVLFLCKRLRCYSRLWIVWV